MQNVQTPDTLIGKTFDCDFGGFIPRLTFLDGGRLHLKAKLGDVDIDEVADVGVTTLRPDLFSVNWTEKSGNFIVQVQDHAHGVVHNYARLADGQQFCMDGALRSVPTA